MSKCILFCAAGFDGLAEEIQKGDFIIAADGGLRHTKALGLAPDLIIGDFDSLGYVPQGARVHPVEKDDTDSMLAVRRALALGYREFMIYGGMDGPRLDHTIANFQLLKYLSDRGAFGHLVGRDYLAASFGPGTLLFPEAKQGDISLFCLGPDAHGVTLRGLYYPLEDGTLTSGFPLGVSNHFTGQSPSVTLREGTLLALWERRAGLARLHR